MNKLSDIAEEIRIQDNLATDQPIFILFDQIHEVAEDGYGDEYVYVDSEGDEIEHTKTALISFLENYSDETWYPEDIDSLSEEEIYEICHDHCKIKEFHVHVIKDFRQAFFTRKSAEQYLEGNRHHFRNPLIWCDTLYRNYEMQVVRKALISNRFVNEGD